MDKLNIYSDKIDSLDKKMIGLFEQRMSFVKKAAEYKAKHNIKLDKKTKTEDIVEAVTSNACDTQVIEYTEGLLMYLSGVSKKYEHKLIKRKG